MIRAYPHLQTLPALAGTGVARVRGVRAQDGNPSASQSGASTPAWPMPSNRRRTTQ